MCCGIATLGAVVHDANEGTSCSTRGRQPAFGGAVCSCLLRVYSSVGCDLEEGLVDYKLFEFCFKFFSEKVERPSTYLQTSEQLCALHPPVPPEVSGTTDTKSDSCASPALGPLPLQNVQQTRWTIRNSVNSISFTTPRAMLGPGLPPERCAASEIAEMPWQPHKCHNAQLGQAQIDCLYRTKMA